MAAERGKREIVRLLLEARAKVDQADNDGRTPLLLAALNDHAQVVRLLLDRGADANKADNDGETPLHWAAGNGHTETVKALLEAGADAKRKDRNGKTPLQSAEELGKMEMKAYLERAIQDRDERAKMLLLILRTRKNASPDVVMEIMKDSGFGYYYKPSY